MHTNLQKIFADKYIFEFQKLLVFLSGICQGFFKKFIDENILLHRNKIQSSWKNNFLKT